MTPIDIVKGVIELFSAPNTWTQGDYALSAPTESDEYGESVSSHDETAVCFCIMGAVDKIAKGSLFQSDASDYRYPEEVVVADALMAEIGDEFPPDSKDAPYEPIAQWNDREGRTIDEVRDLMQRTLKRLESEAAVA